MAVFLFVLQICYAWLSCAFYLFVFSYTPFMGVTVTNFWYCLLFATIILSISVVASTFIYMTKLLKNIYVKVLLALVVSFLTVHITVILMSSIAIVLWLQIVYAVSIKLGLSKLAELHDLRD